MATTRLFRGLITDEGINNARDTQTTQGWFISPFEFSIAETQGDFVTSRNTQSMQSVWYSGKFSALKKQGTDKILLTISLAGDEDVVQRQIKEIYIKCKLPNGNTFLYALIQPLVDMTFTPTVSQEMNFLLSLTNTNKEDVYTIQYIDETKLNSYQLVTEKGQSSGYCPLGADGIVPDAYLPAKDNLPIGTVLPMFCAKDYIPLGFLPCDGAEYRREQFSAVYDDYILTGKLPTCTYTEYKNSLNIYGSCAKFALDVANSKFRVPLIADGTTLQQAKSDSQLSALFNPGLPNITGYTGYGANTSELAYLETEVSNNAFYSKNTSTKSLGFNEFQGHSSEAFFDASRSNSIYGKSSTVQPKAVSLRWFILVTHGVLDATLEDWSAWIKKLNALWDAVEDVKETVTLITTGGSEFDGLYCAQRSGVSTNGNLLPPLEGYFQIQSPEYLSGKTLLVQWGRIQHVTDYSQVSSKYATMTRSFPTPFKKGCYVITSGSSYQQSAGDKGSTVAIWPISKTTYQYRFSNEQRWHDVLFWIAIGE